MSEPLKPFVRWTMVWPGAAPVVPMAVPDPEGQWVSFSAVQNLGVAYCDLQQQLATKDQELHRWLKESPFTMWNRSMIVEHRSIDTEQEHVLRNQKEARAMSVEPLTRERDLDCMSHSCRFASNRTGMRVNGPCRCVQNILDGRAALRQQLAERDATIQDLMAALATRKAQP